MSHHPISFPSNGTAASSSSSSASASSIWSSPNIGQMAEMSQDWFRKMINDSADLIRVSFESSQYNNVELFDFISQSQPLPLQSTYSESPQQQQPIDPFNSLPNQILPDIPDFPIFCDGGGLFTPDPSREPSKIVSSFAASSRESVQARSPPRKDFNQFNFQVKRGRRYHNTTLFGQYFQ